MALSRRIFNLKNAQLLRYAFHRTYAEAAGSNLALTFGTPTQSFFENVNVSQVDLPSASGNFSILAQHVPTIAVLRPGLLTVFEDGNSHKYFVTSGTVTVNSDSSAQILAEEAQPLENFDLDAARRGMEQAKQAVSGGGDEAAKAAAQIEVDTLEALVHALEGK